MAARLASGLDVPVADLERCLRATTSDETRNRVAIALIDRHAADSVPVLMDQLARVEIAPRAGTLVYAVSELGGTLSSNVLATLIEHGSFEAMAEAMTLFDDGRVEKPADDQAASFRAVLERLASGDDPERSEAAADVLANLQALA